MFDNSLDSLKKEMSIKSKVLMEVCNKLKFRITPFETKRTLARQKRLVAQGKSWTLNSKHLDGLAVDRVFKTERGQPSRVGPYPSIHFIGFMCGLTPIYSKGKLIESCHLQCTGETIKQVMIKNSNRRQKETKKNQDLLSLVNTTFRKYGYT